MVLEKTRFGGFFFVRHFVFAAWVRWPFCYFTQWNINLAGFFQPDPKRGLLGNWPWLRQIVGLGAALLPTLSWAGMSCQGPDCPGMLTMLAFFLGPLSWPISLVRCG